MVRKELRNQPALAELIADRARTRAGNRLQRRPVVASFGIRGLPASEPVLSRRLWLVRESCSPPNGAARIACHR